jgi:hypothetical protein
MNQPPVIPPGIPPLPPDTVPLPSPTPPDMPDTPDIVEPLTDEPPAPIQDPGSPSVQIAVGFLIGGSPRTRVPYPQRIRHPLSVVPLGRCIGRLPRHFIHSTRQISTQGTSS